MNRILLEMPILGDDCFAPCTPAWVGYIMRLLFGLSANGMMLMIIHDWDAMPLGFRILGCLITLGFFLFALSSKIGKQQPFFWANHQGMYFTPSGSLVFGQPPRKIWLFVPWKNISNIRVVRIVGGEATKGAALDIQASPEEVAEFFHHYGSPKDSARIQKNDSVAVIFYDNALPSPHKIVSGLTDLMKHR